MCVYLYICTYIYLMQWHICEYVDVARNMLVDIRMSVQASGDIQSVLPECIFVILYIFILHVCFCKTVERKYYVDFPCIVKMRGNKVIYIYLDNDGPIKMKHCVCLDIVILSTCLRSFRTISLWDSVDTSTIWLYPHPLTVSKFNNAKGGEMNWSPLP